MAASGPSLCPVSVLQTLSAQGRNRRRRAIGNCRAEVSSCDPQTPCTATIMRARRIIDKMAGTELRAAAQDSRHQARRRCPGPMRGRSHAAADGAKERQTKGILECQAAIATNEHRKRAAAIRAEPNEPNVRESFSEKKLLGRERERVRGKETLF